MFNKSLRDPKEKLPSGRPRRPSGSRPQNERNVAEVQQQIKPPEEPLETTDNDPTWQTLQECQIMLPLFRLL